MKMLSGAHSSSRPGRTSVTNISASAPSAPGCSFSSSCVIFSSTYSDTLQWVCCLIWVAMVKTFVQQKQEKANKLAPSNTTFSRRENLLLMWLTRYSAYCMSWCFHLYKDIAGKTRLLNLWPIRLSHGSMFPGGRTEWIHVYSKRWQTNPSTGDRNKSMLQIGWKQGICVKTSESGHQIGFVMPTAERTCLFL